MAEVASPALEKSIEESIAKALPGLLAKFLSSGVLLHCKIYIGETGRRLGDRFREHLCDVERNDRDTSKPVARHFNLPNHSKQHMAICSLSLHLGSTESRKTLEQKLIFQSGSLNPTGRSQSFRDSTFRRGQQAGADKKIIWAYKSGGPGAKYSRASGGARRTSASNQSVNNTSSWLSVTCSSPLPLGESNGKLTWNFLDELEHSYNRQMDPSNSFRVQDTLCQNPTRVQDGGAPHGPLTPPQGRLPDETRPQGCLLRSPNLPGIEEILTLPVRENNFRILLPPIRPLTGSQSLHQTPLSRYSETALRGHTFSNLFGRSSPDSSSEGYSSGDLPLRTEAFVQPGFDNETREMLPSPHESPSFPGYCMRYDSNVHCTAKEQIHRIKGACQEMLESREKSLGELSSLLGRMSHAARSGVGCNLPGQKNRGPLECGRGGSAHKLPGTQGSDSCLEVIPGGRNSVTTPGSGPTLPSSYSSGDGQHHGSCVCEQKGGTRSRSLSLLTLELWSFLVTRGSWVTARHLPGVLNVEADTVSKKFHAHTEWMFRKDVFRDITQHFYVQEIDLFASRLKHLVPPYVSRLPDPGASAVDAFQLDWSQWKSFIHPPVVLLSPNSSEIEKRQSNCPTGGPELAGAAMVCSDPADADRGTIHTFQGEVTAVATFRSGGSSSPVAVTQPDCLADFATAYHAAGFPEEVTNILLASWSQSTKKQYGVLGSAPVSLVSVCEEVRRTTSPRQVSTFPPGKYNFVVINLITLPVIDLMRMATISSKF
ncbi:hypothetical protein AWC38_SpisGene13412 [Stylophora pistillata]|uniref:Uncharacterized protein n=1 Tax=Stylophora pistillata TaxID=50429 RepID=A0A2B4RWS5_STYPI|nr:hypothetical protein AWC38_SpisGene13412 [Stylophora pistillata]